MTKLSKKQLIELLKAGKVEEFNRYREDHDTCQIDLSGANLTRSDLTRANLSGGTLFRGNPLDVLSRISGWGWQGGDAL